MTRVFLFLLTNILVVVTINIILSLLGVNHYLTQSGINYQALLIFAFAWGMIGSFISLMLSKWMAKRSMGLQVIDKNTASGEPREVYALVYDLVKKAKLKAMPEVAIYDSPELNAFATGPSQSNSLVAVSTGLLRSMNREEVAGVLAHEISHIKNGDMVTMTLLQGVMNAFTIFFSRVLAFAIASAMRGDDDESPSFWLQYILSIVFDIVFGILASLVTAYFSRIREYRADAGGASLAGSSAMIHALQRLKMNTQIAAPKNEDRSLAAFKISDRPSWMALFSTHPPLDERISRLQKSA